MIALRTYAETAAELGLSVDAVRMAELRALKKLHKDDELRRLARRLGYTKKEGDS